MSGPVAGHPSKLPAGRRRFAHPSERVLAALLDLEGIQWEYEPVEFALAWDERGRVRWGFRPDFWLPEHALFVELTTADQRLVTPKNAKVRRLKALYPDVEVILVYQGDFQALLERNGIGSRGRPAA